jgi:hypothetical protein
MATVFTLEAVFAKKGDALLLHYGPWEAPAWILIDGGPRGVYNRFLRPRLEQLRDEFEIAPDDPIPFELVMVSHVDDDHVAGVIDLFEDIDDAEQSQQPPPYAVAKLWHNSFDDILDNDDDEIVSRMAATAASTRAAGGLPLPKMTRESRAVVASTKQGRDLRNLAKKLRAKLNVPFEGLIMAPAEEDISFEHGLSFTVVGPLEHRVRAYQEEWDKDLKEILEKEENAGRSTAFADDSPFNLASICVLARMAGKSMLLTGDARGDFIIEGLEEIGLLREGRTFHVDVLKVPHHGSDRNVEVGFFERVTADHYVVSGDGEHGNPDKTTLEMVREARDTDEYTVHFTFTEDAHLHETNQRRKAALKKVADWVAQKPDTCTVVFQDADEAVQSIYVDLLDPLFEE